MVECILELLGWNMISSVRPPLGYWTSLTLLPHSPTLKIHSNRGHISLRNMKSPSYILFLHLLLPWKQSKTIFMFNLWFLEAILLSLQNPCEILTQHVRIGEFTPYSYQIWALLKFIDITIFCSNKQMTTYKI